MSAVADAPRGNWVDRFAPAAARPYLRLARADRPIGAWLLLWPCWWSAALAGMADSNRWPDAWHLFLFLAGAIAMRGAGCTYNDLVDRDIDAMVERTRSRPLPSGQISPAAALLQLVVLALVGLIVLLQFNDFTIMLGFASLGVVAIYPFMKRISSWPQVVLGLAFGWGSLMGWAAAFGSLAWPAVLLYAATIAWIIGYDTIYAHQDKEDDAIIGVKSTALRFGDKTPVWLAAFYGLAWLGWLVTCLAAGGGLVSVAILLVVAGHLAWQVATLDTDDPQNCLERFRSNHGLGALVFLSFLANPAIAALMAGLS